MKTTELKKALKGAQIEIRSSTRPYGYMVTEVLVKYYRGDYLETLVKFNAQANDLRHSDHTGREEPKRKHMEVNLPDFGGFYACQSNAKISLDGYSFNTSEDATTLGNFYKIIRQNCELRNFNYVYPDCQLSRMMASLQDLGCMFMKNTVEGLPDWEWKQQRRDSKPEETQLLEA